MTVDFERLGTEDAPQYREAVFDGVQVKLYDQDYESGMYFLCALCDEIYPHWWCRDRVWQCLPPQVQNKTICLSCFRAVRKLRKLKAFA